MSKLFISHGSLDDAFVRELQLALKECNVRAWIDTRELGVGDRLEPLIRRAIEAATAFLVVVSPNTLQSRWVGKELRYALRLQQARGEGRYSILSLALDGAEPSLLDGYVQSPPPYIRVVGDRSDVAGTVAQILAALGLRADAAPVTKAVPAPAPTWQPAALGLDDRNGFGRDDGIKLVANAIAESAAAALDGATAEASGQLVDTVCAEPRALALLLPSLRDQGLAATQAALVAAMDELAVRFPERCERALSASVELSLRRMSPPNRDRAHVLAVFDGAVSLVVLRTMMRWSLSELDALASELVAAGLATRNPYKHLTLHSALCPYLRACLSAARIQDLRARWVEAMREYVEFLNQQQHEYAEVVATLTSLDRPNLLALLDHAQEAEDAETTLGLTTSLHTLLQRLGRPRLLEGVALTPDRATDRTAAGQARRQAVDCYLAYRRDGGENHDREGRLVLAMSQRLASSGPPAAAAFLEQVAADPNVPAPFRTFMQALQAILKGSRDRKLANAPDLHYRMAAEILLLIETLDRADAAVAPS